jgi:hypothetical protein
MNASLPLSAPRISGQAEFPVTVSRSRRAEVVSVTPVPARRQGALRRFFRALLRSLSALSA